MNLLPFFIVALGASAGAIFGLTACFIGLTVAIVFVIAATVLDV
jgi:hypothetical protein